MAQNSRYLDFRSRRHPDITTDAIARIGDTTYPDAPDHIAFLHQATRHLLAEHGVDHAALYRIADITGVKDNGNILDTNTGLMPEHQGRGMRVRIQRGAGKSSSLSAMEMQGGWAQSLTGWINNSLSPDQAQEFTPLGRIIALDTLVLMQTRASENLIPAWRGATSPIGAVNTDMYITAGDMMDAAMISMLRLDLSPGTIMAGCDQLAGIMATHQGVEQAPGQPVANLRPARDLIPSNQQAAYLAALPYGQSVPEATLDTGLFRVHDFDQVMGERSATLSRLLHHCHDRGCLELWSPAEHPLPMVAMDGLHVRPFGLPQPMRAVLGEMADHALGILSDGLNLSKPAHCDLDLRPVPGRYPPGQYGPPPQSPGGTAPNPPTPQQP